ncbi:MAG: hypothetical protein F6K10_29325 [Moorea sp. SIO2B7]|nr:hypothetical protein [Moorena sp. SIO2B7]
MPFFSDRLLLYALFWRSPVALCPFLVIACCSVSFFSDRLLATKKNTRSRNADQW